MKSLPWIRVLIKMSTIKEAKTMGIAWKVRGYPVQDHANAILVKSIDQEGKITAQLVGFTPGDENKLLRDVATLYDND